jgi:PAS domain S-box-containing protein
MDGRLDLRRRLARRLLPLTLGIGMLISAAIPAVNYAIESAALQQTAAAHARDVAHEVGHLITITPTLWRFQTAKIEALLRNFRREAQVRTIRVVDASGRVVAEHRYGAPAGRGWRDRFDRVATVPIIFNNRTLGTVQVVVSAQVVLQATLMLLALCSFIGVSLALLAYRFPMRAVASVEGQIESLLNIARQSQAETERLNTVLEHRVAERTSQLLAQEHELHEAKAFLEHLILASPGMIHVANLANDSVTYISPNVQQILGYTPAEVMRAPGFWLNHIHPERRQQFLERRARAHKERTTLFEFDLDLLHKNGTYRWFYYLVRYEYGEDGTPLRAMAYGLDVTDRKSGEDAVRRAKEEAERASQAKSDFLSRMSHELRTPLNAIMGFAQLLELDARTPEAQENVAHILKGGQRLLQLINEVLDIASIDAGRLTISLEPVPLGKVFQVSLELLASLAAQHQVRLIGDGALTQDVHVMADRQRLEQVLLSLLSNGIKYNRPGGSVELSCEETPAGRIRINVRDTGPGIPAEKLGRLFLPFDRLGLERVGIDGAGVGLALCKGLVELMGGEIGVESVAGHGSTFWVDLAPAEGPVDQYQRLRVDQPAAIAVRGPAAGPIRTVLYIEDNVSNVELIERVLAQRPEVKLLAAMQGRMGVDLARRHRPDLILLDVHLPDLTGDEVLRRLREDPQTRGIPVVVLSADPEADHAEQLLALGAQAMLTKPLDVEKFLTILDGGARSISHA